METERREHNQALIKALETIDRGLSLLRYHIEHSTGQGLYVEPALLSAINDIKRNRETIAGFVE